MRFPRVGMASMAVALAALAVGTSGCLITDPILPLDSATNTPPTFRPGRPQPDTSAPVNVPNSSQQIIFDASAQDAETDYRLLVYTWTLDGNRVVSPTEDAPTYVTNGAAMGSGNHTLDVLIADNGTPQQFLEATWQITVGP